MTDPRIELFLRSAAGLLVMAGMLWWLWDAGRARAERLLGPTVGDVTAMAVITWACAILTLAAMLLGALGALQPLAWGALVVWGGLLLRSRRGVTRKRYAGTGWVADPWDPAPSWAFKVGAAALVLGRLMYGLRNPPSDVDSILYHLPMVAHWMATGGLGATRIEPQLLGAFYPGNVEVLSLGFAWLVGRETLMTVPGVLSLGLLAIALRRLAIEVGARSAIAEALALALACAPGVLQLTLGLRVDNVVAAWFAVALLFALRARRSAARGDVEVALCSLGLLAGSKATGPALAMLVIAALACGAGWRARLAAVRSSPLGLATLLIAGGFWLARNAIAAGNPVYPATITLGAWALPGLSGHPDIALTSQFAIWRSGLPGNLSVANLWRYFGPVGLMLVPGACAGLVLSIVPNRPGIRRAPIALLAAVALAAAVLTVFQPFSGANEPELPGGPLSFSTENARYVMPTMVASVPLAAVGLSALPVLPVVLTCTALMLTGLSPRAGHMLPALALVVLAGALWTMRSQSLARSRAWRAVVLVAPCALLAAAVTLVEPMRERMADRSWDAIIQRFDGVPSAVAREVRAASAGRPIAVAGQVSSWAFYGRELSGRPEYVPVGTPLADARASWRYGPDPRDRADAALWMRNLKESGAPFVVIVTGERLRPVERVWCERDPAHFAPVYVTAQRAVYRVTGN